MTNNALPSCWSYSLNSFDSGRPSTSHRRLRVSRLVDTWAFSILLNMPWLISAIFATSASFRSWAWRWRLICKPRYCSSLRRGAVSVGIVIGSCTLSVQ
ncbi:hypothetical protein D3C79_929430 [compost metagenome]